MRLNINRYDIYNENFENWFNDLVFTMTDNHKSKLTDELNYKLLKNKKNPSATLNFVEKVYVLSVCFNKNIGIVIQDNSDGLSIENFEAATEAHKGKLTNTALLNTPKTQSNFIIADNNLFNSMMYLNHVYTTEIYQLVRPLNAARRSNRDKLYNMSIDGMKALVKLLMSYESNKKRIVIEYNLTVAKVYALLYFSTGEKAGRDFYDKDFKLSYSANYRDMYNALKELYMAGYLNRRGHPKHRYSLSAKGNDLLNKMMDRIISFYKQ